MNFKRTFSSSPCSLRPQRPREPQNHLHFCGQTRPCPGCWAFVPPKPGAGLLAVALGHLQKGEVRPLGRQKTLVGTDQMSAFCC